MSIVVVIALVAVATRPVSAASTGTVVSATVPAAITLSDQCGHPTATNFGAVLPGSPAISATGANVCRFSFGSSNSSSRLRIYQADTTGSAMVGQPSAWTTTGIGSSAQYIVEGFGASLIYAIPSAGASGLYSWSSDGGASWNSDAPGGGAYPLVSVTSATVAWRLQGGSDALRSNNANASPGPPTWNTVSRNLVGGGTWSSIDDVDAVDYNTAWLVNGNTAYRTINPVAAQPWDVGTTGCTFESDRIDALDANTAFVTGIGRICRTTTGPAGWAQITTGIPAGLKLMDIAISPQTATTIWASGEDGVVLRSTNNGTNWSTVSLPTPVHTRTIQALSDAEAFVGTDDGLMYRTTTSGASWTRFRTRTTSDITSFHAASSNIVLHNNGGESYWRTGDGGTTWTQSAGGREDALIDIDAIDDDVIVAAKGNGVVRVTTDGGTSWNDRATGLAPDNVRGVAVIDGLTYIAVGDQGAIARTEDGGLTWSRRTSGTAEDLWDVDLEPGGVAIAVGAAGTILRSTDFGLTWSVRASSGADLREVSIRSNGPALAVGLGGVIRRSTDGGSTWTTPTSGVATNLDAVQTPSPTVAYASTRGTLLKSTDGGATWASIALASTFRQVAAVSEDVLYVAKRQRTGYSQWVARSDDGGQTWVSPFANHNPLVRSVHAIDGGRVLFGSDADWVRITTAGAAIPDYGGGATWAAGGMFGACLQDIGGAATASAWTEDVTGTVGTCEAADTDAWYAIPIAPAKIAQMAAAGTGTVDLVWGFRPTSGQAAGTYTAGIVIEATAPNV